MSDTTSISLAEMRRLVRMAVWASLISLGAWVILPVGVVPVTLQTFFIFLAAYEEGPTAFFAAALYLMAGLVGLPVFTGGHAGPALIFGPTAGYALSFPLVALVAGLGRGRRGRTLARMLPFGLAALGLLYFCGTVGLVVNMGFDFSAAAAMNLTFLPGDLAKMAAASAVARGMAARRRRAGPPLVKKGAA
jgi:biotin transport system substrate-specific component